MFLKWVDSDDKYLLFESEDGSQYQVPVEEIHLMVWAALPSVRKRGFDLNTRDGIRQLREAMEEEKRQAKEDLARMYKGIE